MELRHFHAVTGIALVATLTFAPVVRAEDVIKIGAPLALTGPLSAEAKKQETVWDMWLAKVNASGGIKVGSNKMRVELVKYDYQSDGPRSAQLAEKLLTDDKVNFLLAPFGSGHTKIVATVAERYQTPVIACASSAESVFNQGFKNLFGTLSPNGGMTDAMVAFFKSKMPQLHRVAVLGRDDVFPKSMAEGISDAAKKAGLDVVYDKLYPVGTMDQSSAMSAIKEAKPDWIYVSGYTQDLILARKQMADLSVSAPIVTMVTGPAYKEFTEGLGDLANDITSSSWWHHATNYQGIGPWRTTADFYSEFVKQNHNDPDYVHASCAAAIIVLADAIERAGTMDKAKVRDALAATNVNTFYGPVKFTANGMNQVRDLPIIQVQNKTIKVLNPTDLKNGELHLIKG
jgi:branched-chain amino acid transport system substrate-binding protein